MPEGLLAVTGRGLLLEQDNKAVRKFLNEANKLDARESANLEHEHSRQADHKKETRRQKRKRQKEDKRKKREERTNKKTHAEKKGTASTELNNSSAKKHGQESLRKRAADTVEGGNIEDGISAIAEAIDQPHREHIGSDEEVVPNQVECSLPREPIWEYENYGEDHEAKANKRLLIGLYSGFGVYGSLLTKTAHVNRAYARHWKHDVVLVQGAALQIKELDGDCEPPPHRATYDKIPLLRYALEHKDQYDQLLILDTDALVYDMDFDVTSLLPKGKMLAAQKVRESDDHETWDINAGVTLWDLHHPRIQKLTKEWFTHSKSGMEHNYHASNDQYHLHYALKEGNYKEDIFALDEEFNYGHGTIVKHFIRKPQHKQWGEAAILDNRENRIEIAIEEICKKHKPICEAVDKKVYSE